LAAFFQSIFSLSSSVRSSFMKRSSSSV